MLNEVKNGQLNIRMRLNERYKNFEVNVALNYINLNVINVSSTGMFEGSDQLKSKKLGFNVSSLDCLKLNVFCNNFI